MEVSYPGNKYFGLFSFPVLLGKSIKPCPQERYILSGYTAGILAETNVREFAVKKTISTYNIYNIYLISLIF